jgi:hypothetical protein
VNGGVEGDRSWGQDRPGRLREETNERDKKGRGYVLWKTVKKAGSTVACTITFWVIGHKNAETVQGLMAF